MLRDLRERRARADQDVAIRFDSCRATNARERDQHLRAELTALHVWIQVRPARNEHDAKAWRTARAIELARTQVLEHLGGLAVLGRKDDPEARKPQHQGAVVRFRSRATVVASSRRMARLGSPFPSPSPAGPMRFLAMPRLSRLPSASRTFSAVIGVSSKRTPIASYTAFAMAGITGFSGPSPASFAPKGPSASTLSTTIASSAGVSSEVGIL